MVKIQVLKFNPFITTRHYQYYFKLPQRTAHRYHLLDKAAMGKPLLTFQDFFNRYGGFPCPKFRPIWQEIEVPEILVTPLN